MEIIINLQKKSYPIIIKRGCLNSINDYIDTKRKVLIITDDLVPTKYSEKVKEQCSDGYIFTVVNGEQAKSMEVYQSCLEELLRLNFNRKDLVIAVGGGVVGDLSGFVASSYLRGIDFINIPTTTLAQIDSSIGGKVAINLKGIKNCVGAFYQPKAVLIDPDTIDTLPTRHFYNGLCEAVKTGLIGDSSLFELFKSSYYQENYEEIITKSLLYKKKIVEIDEKELKERKLLNYGHTIGHGIESYYQLNKYYHGECVLMGMEMISNNPQIKQALKELANNFNIKIDMDYDVDKVMEYIKHDKKSNGDNLTIVQVDKIGEGYLQEISLNELKGKISDEKHNRK